MCSAPNVYMFVYILIGTHMVPLKLFRLHTTFQILNMEMPPCVNEFQFLGITVMSKK